MAKVFLITQDKEKTNKLEAFFERYNYQYLTEGSTQGEIVSKIAEFFPDIVLIDSEFENASNITKIIKSSISSDNIQILVILPKNNEEIEKIDYLSFSDGYIRDINEKLLKIKIDSHLKIKNTLDSLSENNKDLSKSLYRLNALYNTSSQFAGTLDREKLCHITLEGLEQILSYDIASILIFDEEEKGNLYIKSLSEISNSLSDGLTLRLLLNYKHLFQNSELPFEISYNNIKLIKEIKPSSHIYDLKALSFDSIFMPIKVENHFFGVIEILREIPFSHEDILSCQTVIHQVALPFRSATLYEEIKKTNVKLQKLEKIKSEFVSIVSHELRTPLTPINNSLEIVLSEQAGEINENIKNFVQMAKRNVTRLSGIIEDLLDLSRIQTGKFDFKFKKTNIISTLELIKQTFYTSANERSMDFQVGIPDEQTDLYVDTHRIEQILSNLISNALKFTSDGGKIYVKTESVKISEEEGSFITPQPIISNDYLKITVEDSGIGINEEDIEGIFNKFSQIESSLNRNKGGIGLGLTITKQLIDSHFGLVSVKSKKDKGSTFSVYLPFYDEKNAFKIELEDAVSKNEELGLIKIKFKGEPDFINYLKENNILKRSQNSKELLIDKGDNKEYWLFTPKVQKQIFDFIEKAISSELEKESAKWEKYDILFKRADIKDKNSFNKLKKELD